MKELGILETVVAELTGEGQNLLGWGVAWARLIPTVFIVPAFGLGLFPASLRAAMALSLAVAIAPALGPAAAAPGVPWPSLVARELLRGLPIALSAAISLWVAATAGGVLDVAGRATRFAPIEGPLGRRTTPLATLFGLGAAIVFLDHGAAARLVARLAHEPAFSTSAVARAATDLAAGIGLGASIGAPVLAAALGLDVAIGIALRERSSVSLESVFASLRTIAVLIATAALLDRMLEATVVFSPGSP